MIISEDFDVIDKKVDRFIKKHYTILFLSMKGIYDD